MLTVKKLKEMPKNTIFATGEIVDSPDGINLADTGKMLRWIAKRGYIHDWCIYAHFADKDISWIEDNGDKVHREAHIKKLIECDDEAFSIYRH